MNFPTRSNIYTHGLFYYCSIRLPTYFSSRPVQVHAVSALTLCIHEEKLHRKTHIPGHRVRFQRGTTCREWDQHETAATPYLLRRTCVNVFVSDIIINYCKLFAKFVEESLRHFIVFVFIKCSPHCPSLVVALLAAEIRFHFSIVVKFLINFLSKLLRTRCEVWKCSDRIEIINCMIAAKFLFCFDCIPCTAVCLLHAKLQFFSIR